MPCKINFCRVKKMSKNNFKRLLFHLNVKEIETDGERSWV